jgi:Protein of unknown function, DUF481
MKCRSSRIRLLGLFGLWAAWSAAVSADVIEIKGGSRLVGTITEVDGASIFLKTEYAGVLKVKKGEVVSLRTEQVRFVHLNDGQVFAGTVEPASMSHVQVHGVEGDKVVEISQIAEMQAPSLSDATKPKWHYEATGDVVGKAGNHDQLNSALSGRAKRVGTHDVFQFYSAYQLQKTDQVVSADQFKIGLDYADNYAGRKSWYVRDEEGFDRVKRVDLYSVAASGAGYDFVKKNREILTGRTGLSFRYEAYQDPNTPSVASLGLDLGLHHSYTFSDSKLVNDLTIVPAFNEITNYHVQHESYFEVPLAMRGWKLRLGLGHDYTSMPGNAVQKLDTTYFTRFVFNWD